MIIMILPHYLFLVPPGPILLLLLGILLIILVAHTCVHCCLVSQQHSMGSGVAKYNSQNEKNHTKNTCTQYKLPPFLPTDLLGLSNQ